jgi:hypothetical protein
MTGHLACQGNSYSLAKFARVLKYLSFQEEMEYPINDRATASSTSIRPVFFFPLALKILSI